MKNIAVIGSTGSIGVNTLRVVESHPGRFRVTALAAGKNIGLLLEQVRRFRPLIACLHDEAGAKALAAKLRGTKTRVVSGPEGLKEAASLRENRLVIFSMVGARGLHPLVAAIKAGKSVAFANKEPFVMAGELIRRLSLEHGVSMVPIDSELSAIFQCLEGRSREEMRRIILTSSGGPFRAFSAGALRKVTPAQALRHPRWKMGKKITIDSSTLMNKALEVIEAANYFDVPVEKVGVLIHPEAIVHSLVEFIDGSHLAQLGVTDMRLPIQYAMSYPGRFPGNGFQRLDLAGVKSLSFENPDLARFPCLGLGYEAKRAGGTLPAVLNAANEVAVELFLNERLSFSGIPARIERLMRRHRLVRKPGLGDILEADEWARKNF